jgi:hypothetical protein
MKKFLFTDPQEEDRNLTATRWRQKQKRCMTLKKIYIQTKMAENREQNSIFVN